MTSQPLELDNRLKTCDVPNAADVASAVVKDVHTPPPRAGILHLARVCRCACAYARLGVALIRVRK